MVRRVFLRALLPARLRQLAVLAWLLPVLWVYTTMSQLSAQQMQQTQQAASELTSEAVTESTHAAADAFDQGEYDKAMELIEKELAGGGLSEMRKAELNSRLLFIQATMAMNEGKYKEALQFAQSALNDPGVINKEVFWRLQGQTQFAQKDYAAARESLSRALQLDPDEKGIYFDLGELAFAQGDWLAASLAYNQFIVGAQEARDARLKLLYCKIALGELGYAKRLLNEFDVFDEKHPGYYFGKSAIAHAEGKQSEAQNLLDQVQTIYGITTLYRYQVDYFAIFKPKEKQIDSTKQDVPEKKALPEDRGQEASPKPSQTHANQPIVEQPVD